MTEREAVEAAWQKAVDARESGTWMHESGENPAAAYAEEIVPLLLAKLKAADALAEAVDYYHSNSEEACLEGGRATRLSAAMEAYRAAK